MNARQSLRSKGLKNVEIMCADCRDLRYIESNSCDAVVSNLLLHLVPEPKRCFAEVMRILKPGGVFAFSCAGPARDQVRFLGG
jgi:ubiquinone/menaquinone biosynthesis C-methylase UbiE